MSVCRLEVGTSCFAARGFTRGPDRKGARVVRGRDVPAPAPLICNERELIERGYVCDELGIMLYGADAVCDCEVGAREKVQGAGDGCRS